MDEGEVTDTNQDSLPTNTSTNLEPGTVGINKFALKLTDIRKKAQAYSQQLTLTTKPETDNQVVATDKKRADLLLDEVCKDIQSVRDAYQIFAVEVLKDSTLRSEVTDAYVEQTIKPCVEDQAANNHNPEADKDEFYERLRSFIEHRGKPDCMDYYDELNKIVWNHGGSIANDMCCFLANGEDWQIIEDLIEYLAVEDIRNIIQSVSPIQNKFWQEWEFNSDIKRAIASPTAQEQQIVSNLPFHIMDRLFEESRGNRLPNMDFWNALRSSKTAREVFGNLINDLDKKYYSTIIDDSLDLGDGFIELLQYYPTPEAVRNLIILATADQDENLTVYANRALGILKSRTDWKEILDATAKVYPALTNVRPLLEDWYYDGENNNPEIQNVAKDFILTIFNSKPADQSLLNLCIRALPNSTLTDILHGNGVLDPSTVSILRNIQNLFDKQHELWIHDRDQYFETNIDDSFLKSAIRSKLEDLMFSAPQDDPQFYEDVKSSLNRLAYLSEKVINNIGDNRVVAYLTSKEVVVTIATKKVAPELIISFPEYASGLMDDKFSETRSFIFKNSETLLKNIEDLKFLNRIVGESGQKADLLIRSYYECLKAGVITVADKELVAEFLQQFRALSPTTIQGYKEAKLAGHENIYIAQLKALAERMTGSSPITDEERKQPYYQDLLRHVYANNSGQWTSYGSNESCQDRSGDVSSFKTSSRYEIDLLSQSEIRVKEGEEIDRLVMDDVQKPIFKVAERMSELGHDKEKIQVALQENVDNTLAEIKRKGGLPNIDLSFVNTLEEKLFLILTDSIYGNNSIDPKTIKDLMIFYEFAAFEDISDYIAGTRDKVGRASNQDYALLCEVGTFYSDRIKEVNRRLVQAAWNNSAIASLMPEYFRKLGQDVKTTQRQDLINRLQLDKLGISESFTEQARKLLEKRYGDDYSLTRQSPDDEKKRIRKSPEEINTILERVKKLIARYEASAGFLQGQSTSSEKPTTRALYGKLRSQRERTFEALKAITGQETDPKETSLGEIDLQQALDIETSVRQGKYDEEQFASYTVQRFIDLFEDERLKVENELAKYESLSGKQREILYGYITKCKESAHARMVGGVCVSGDNPDKYKDKNMWNMPNYFQMVFQEPDTLQCQGLVLLHHFNQDGKKVLTASFNPSSTYLYSVDEAALFGGIVGSLVNFAKDNGFDLIAVSRNKTIRTNRTGGEFEKAMDKQITEIGKTFTFDSPQHFSYHPEYKVQEMDIIWEK